MRKTFLENLPHGGKYLKETDINWKKSAENNIYFVYDDLKGFLKIIKYNEQNKKLIVEYSNEIYEINQRSLLDANLGRILGRITKQFKIEINTIFKDDKRDITIIDREYRIENKSNGSKAYKKYYKYYCNVCGYEEGWIEEHAIINKNQGCSCCSGMVVILGINSIYDTDPWMIPMVGEEFSKTHTHGNNTDKIYPICADCGRRKDIEMTANAIYRYKSVHCLCGKSKSYPEKIMYNILEQLEIDFESEKVFSWCKYKFDNNLKQGRYDFYFVLNNKEYILEMDGGWHNNDNIRSGRTAKESKYIDDEKDRLANEHGIKVIRINCDYGHSDRFEYIKNNILNNENINKLINLSQIEWLECEEFATFTNLNKKICEYFERNKISASEVSKVFKISNETTCRILNKGNKFGWCNYDGNHFMKNSNNKQIKIFKDNILLGTFISAVELSEKSEELFGIKLKVNSIYEVCNGSLKTYKKYTFSYENKLNIQRKDLI